MSEMMSIGGRVRELTAQGPRMRGARCKNCGNGVFPAQSGSARRAGACKAPACLRTASALGRAMLVAALLCLAAGARADWQVDNDRSVLAFVTVKAGDAAEVHRFGEIAGQVADDGTVSIEIDLASVDTLIPIRDERIRDLLFETARFPAASLSAQLDAGRLAGLAVGETEAMPVNFVLSLKEHELPLLAQVLVARLSERDVLVASLKPVVVNAPSVGLVEGVEKLREIAGLPSISKAVPVTFVLVLERGE